jgi:hypothetical protein
MFLWEPVFQFRNKVAQRYAEPIADHLEFDDIDTALAALDLADSGLFKGKLLAYLGLRDAGLMPNLDKQLQKGRVVPRMNTFAHHVDAMLHAKVE